MRLRITIHSIVRFILPDILPSCIIYIISTSFVFIGVNIGANYLYIVREDSTSPNLSTACSRRNGQSYIEIAEKGYSYNESNRSSVAFFPAYPLLAKFVSACVGCSTTIALLLTSNIALLVAIAATSAFVRTSRFNISQNERYLILSLMAIFPPTFFFRMAYAESTLFLALAAFLNCIARRWPHWLVAIIAGWATAIRPVGVACTIAFLWTILFNAEYGSIWRRIRLSTVYLPLACWGLLAFMFYLKVDFGNSLAFAQTQSHFSYLPRLNNDYWDKAESLLSGEPIWSIYDPESPRYWGRVVFPGNPVFSLYFWNPLIFLSAFLLITIGWRKHWLAGYEVVLGVALLTIPYLTRSYEMSMISHARFASIVLPAYIVAGRIIHHMPQWIAWSLFGVFSTSITIWSAFFAADIYLF
jgi:hypothetical protein